MNHLCTSLLSTLASTALVVVMTASASAQSAPSGAMPQVASETLPGPSRLNGALPTWLRMSAELRERMESSDGAGYTRDRNDTFWLTRLRFSTSITAAPWLHFNVQLQDARVAGKDIGAGGAPFSAPIDVRLAYVDVGAPNGHVSARVGRQELAFGEQRLVGHVSWANAARSFDAARVVLKGTSWQVDAFLASVVRIDVDGRDTSGNGNRFHGAYATTNALIPGSNVQPYFFWRSDRDQRLEAGGTGQLQVGTTGVRAVGRLPAGFDYGFEVAVQRGSVGSDSSRAWAEHLRVRTPALAGRLRLIGEYNHASGDEHPDDGKRGTFDHLYPTPHDKYGLSDQVGWRNVHHVRAAVEVATVPGLPITAGYHSWWLASATDGLYSAPGALVARLPEGAPDRHVGHEFDLQASRALTPQLQLAGGYAHIRPGAFLKAATPGSSFHSAYVMLTYVFLAER